MRPLVIDYLKTHTFRQLKEEHGVAARSSTAGDKFSLNYDQILAKSSNAIANQCRGLVVRPSVHLPAEDWEDQVVGDCTVLAWPMNRFFNLGDPAAAHVDWDDSQLNVMDKVDGTCCIFYWDSLHSQWHVATRSVPEADIPIKKGHLVIGDSTFSELFKRTFEAEWARVNDHLVGISPYSFLNTRWTYVFELTSPYNRIVVKYDEPRITLLAARDLDDGSEVYINSPIVKSQQSGIGWIARPNSWNICEPIALTAFLDLQDPSKTEGAVVCDSQFNRIKIKSKAYFLSFKMKDMLQLSRRSVLEAVLSGKIDDVLPHLEPVLAEHVRDLQERVRVFCADIDKNFRKWKDQANGDRKALAILVQSSGEWHPPYYAMLNSDFRSSAEWAESTVKAGKLSQATLEYLVGKLKWNPKVE